MHLSHFRQTGKVAFLTLYQIKHHQIKTQNNDLILGISSIIYLFIGIYSTSVQASDTCYCTIQMTMYRLTEHTFGTGSDPDAANWHFFECVGRRPLRVLTQRAPLFFSVVLKSTYNQEFCCLCLQVPSMMFFSTVEISGNSCHWKYIFREQLFHKIAFALFWFVL